MLATDWGREWGLLETPAIKQSRFPQVLADESEQLCRQGQLGIALHWLHSEVHLVTMVIMLTPMCQACTAEVQLVILCDVSV